jgi:site-specific DNA recombinase
MGSSACWPSSKRPYVQVPITRHQQVAKLYKDNDISAFRGKWRPAYQAMLDDVKNGQVDGILCWHNDRLHRHQRELEDFIELVDQSAIPVQSVTAGIFNLSDASGRMTARILGAVARQESEHKAERQRAKHDELAAQGSPSGGTRPFGLTVVKHGTDGRSYREEVPEEADAIREAARDIIAGTSVREICRRWEAEGLRGTRGARLSPQVVNGIMTSEWVAGRRAGKLAQWPAVLDEETWRLVGAVIKSQGDGPELPSGTAQRHSYVRVVRPLLLSRPKAGGKPAYICGADLGGCGKIRVLAADFEQDVLERLFDRIDPEQLRDHQPADDGTAKAMAEMARLEGVKTRLAELAGTGELDLTEFRAAKATNDRAMQALRETLARSAEDEAMQRARAEAVDLPDKWDDLGIEDRRRVVQALADRIEVGPAVKGRNFYAPERVKVTYR